MRIKNKGLIKYFGTNELTDEVIKEHNNFLVIKQDCIRSSEVYAIISSFPAINGISFFNVNQEDILKFLQSLPPNNIKNVTISGRQENINGISLDTTAFRNLKQLGTLAIASSDKPIYISRLDLPSTVALLQLYKVKKIKEFDESQRYEYFLYLDSTSFNSLDNKFLNAEKVSLVLNSNKEKLDFNHFFNYPKSHFNGLNLDNVELDNLRTINSLIRRSPRIQMSLEMMETYKKFLTENPQIDVSGIAFGSTSIYNIAAYEQDNARNTDRYVLPGCMVKSGIDYAKLRNSGKQVVFEISNVTDLDMNDIKKIKQNGIDFKVSIKSDDNEYYQNCEYTMQDYQCILVSLNELLEDIDENASEKEKFEQIYGRVINSIEYDYVAAYPKKDDKDQKEYSEKNVANCRNLLNGLLSDKAVCAGYADILKNACIMKGIDCRYVQGPVDYINFANSLNENTQVLKKINDKECVAREYHAWNKVKLDGVWYNCDPTWDKCCINERSVPLYALRSDDDYKKIGRPLTDKNGPECSVTMIEEKKQEVFPGRNFSRTLDFDDRLIEFEQQLDENGNYFENQKQSLFKRVFQRIKDTFSRQKRLPAPSEVQDISSSSKNRLGSKRLSWELDDKTMKEVKSKEQEVYTNSQSVRNQENYRENDTGEIGGRD